MDDTFLGYLVKGRYKLIDQIAEGAFGSVYIARDLETNYLYAVKLLHDKFLRNTEILQRFQREASLPLGIDDPHIVHVIDYGWDGQVHFIVMDYVDGHNLRTIMQRRGPFPLETALDYAEQVALGLEAANCRGIVHRDLKPQNILVNNRGEVKITDFGLARAKDTPTITETDEFMGTAYYISPEQIDSGHAADIRSDLYSLAAILFEMLAGQPPYRGSNVMELIVKHKSTPIPALHPLRPDLPPIVDQFFQKGLAKRPERRYQTPQEFIDALQNLRRAAVSLPQQTSQPRVPADPLALPEQSTVIEAPAATEKAPVPRAAARLVHLATGEVFLLVNQEIIIGRRDPMRNLYPDISLADKMVGRRHACIRNRQGTFFTIEDLHSRNRTRLNGRFLPPGEERALKHGDILRFGNIEMRFELINGHEQAPTEAKDGEEATS
ncbi:FHA domain-containing serine/threonine-protein kinase [Thermogemmatispora onikobensis]|uniref:FHA domain-containing serine/threonine-protein kinase n=1 Tax=Thermogemmatispora onikobensis TaxID=732234 RepID=UPI000852FB21|nr:FHA domain-containing serine/threonine-protein kinase [Thermogemmatispora onikobensis]